jgi:hypothetical protein
MNPDTQTPEQIAQHYRAAMDSVNFINEIKAGKHDERLSVKERAEALDRNAGHLEIMLAKNFWTTEDLQPFRDAVAAARA